MAYLSLDDFVNVDYDDLSDMFKLWMLLNYEVFQYYGETTEIYHDRNIEISNCRTYLMIIKHKYWYHGDTLKAFPHLRLHILPTLSFPPVAITPYLGCSLTVDMKLSCALSIFFYFPCVNSHTLNVLSSDTL